MKQVVSISLGSSKRDHQTEVELLGQRFLLKRIGTNGNLHAAIDLLKEHDGKVAAIGLGGIDLYIVAGKRRYVIRDAKKMQRAVKKTPVVDGSGLKHTLERSIPSFLYAHDFSIKDKKVLMLSAVDRFGLAEGFVEAGCSMIFGDQALVGIPFPLRSMGGLIRFTRIAAPIGVLLPFHWFYPTGDAQEKKPSQKYAHWFEEADIIASDFLLIRKYLPPSLEGKLIITNTTTANDLAELRSRGVECVITSTPRYEGRTFGTNVMEALIVALIDKPLVDITEEDYANMIEKLELKPQILSLRKSNSVRGKLAVKAESD